MVIRPAPHYGRYPTPDELMYLHNSTRDWLIAHGHPAPAENVEGFRGDLPIAEGSAHYSADIPVWKLRLVVPKAAGTLILGGRFAASFYEPNYSRLEDASALELSPPEVQFMVPHTRRSAFAQTDYHLRIRPDRLPEERLVCEIREPGLSFWERVVRGREIQEQAGYMRMTFAEHDALRAIMEAWAKHGRWLSPGPDRKEHW